MSLSVSGTQNKGNWLASYSDMNSCSLTIGYNNKNNVNNIVSFCYNLNKILNDGNPSWNNVSIPNSVNPDNNGVYWDITSANILTDSSGTTWVICAFFNRNPTATNFGTTKIYLTYGNSNNDYNGIISGNNWMEVGEDLTQTSIMSIVADNINNSLSSTEVKIFGTTFYMIVNPISDAYDPPNNYIGYIVPQLINNEISASLETFIGVNSIYISPFIGDNPYHWYTLGYNNGKYNSSDTNNSNFYNVYGNSIYINAISNGVDVSRVFAGIYVDFSANPQGITYVFSCVIDNYNSTTRLPTSSLNRVVAPNGSPLLIDSLVTKKQDGTVIYAPITGICVDDVAITFVQGTNVYYACNPYTVSNLLGAAIKPISYGWSIATAPSNNNNWLFFNGIINASGWYYIITNTQYILYTNYNDNKCFFQPQAFQNSSNYYQYQMSNSVTNLFGICNILTNNYVSQDPYGNNSYFLYSSLINTGEVDNNGETYVAFYTGY